MEGVKVDLGQTLEGRKDFDGLEGKEDWTVETAICLSLNIHSPLSNE